MVDRHPSKSIVNLGSASVDNFSSGWQSTMSSRKECNIYILSPKLKNFIFILCNRIFIKNIKRGWHSLRRWEKKGYIRWTLHARNIYKFGSHRKNGSRHVLLEQLHNNTWYLIGMATDAKVFYLEYVWNEDIRHNKIFITLSTEWNDRSCVLIFMTSPLGVAVGLLSI